jgi:hypothetical protein
VIRVVSKDQHLTCAAAARLLGRDTVSFWRDCKAGKFPRVKLPGKKCWSISVADLQRHTGRVFSDAEIASAIEKPGSRKRYDKADVDKIFSKMLLAVHETWMSWLGDPEAKKKLPFGPTTAACFANLKKHELYTRPQLDTAINNALDQRDLEWTYWNKHAAERALHPSKPRRRAV